MKSAGPNHRSQALDGSSLLESFAAVRNGRSWLWQEGRERSSSATINGKYGLGVVDIGVPEPGFFKA